ncbi:ATP-binding protein [Acidianus sp. RZ1]|uniref:AAA family ATPase n=1 Tax=Acidianus sp. RZ1 TaxID=1540082 RepID=UPI00149114E2|nr:ATP-binding protein [Acidianus sp. RZ1]
MLFSPEPKSDRKDLYDREKELEQLKSLSSPISLVLGLRRTGKFSLINVALNELGIPYIYIDLRKYEEKSYVTYKDILQDFEKEINRLTHKFPGLLDLMKRLRGVSILGNSITLAWGGKDKVSFSSLLETLNDWGKFVLVLDEAQELIKVRGLNLLPIFAYSFDRLGKVKIILGGSKMGMLYRFLRVKDPDSPLYGKAMNEVILRPFTKSQSIDFLRRGFEEANVPFNKEEDVYETLGGIPGWLTYFGYKYVQHKDFEKSMKETLEYVKGLIMKEFDNFLLDKQIAKERYLRIMKTVSKCATWSQIKNSLESLEGRRISDSEVKRYLDNLMDASFIEKKEEGYCPSDPLIGITFS